MSGADRESSVQGTAAPGNPFAGRLAVTAQAEPGLDEVRRICALPVMRPLSQEEVEAISAQEVMPEAYASGFRLWRQQAEALLAYQSDGGLFAPLRVAGGKTFITYLVAKHAYQREGLERILVLVPPDLLAKALTRDVPKVRKLFGLQAPVHGMGSLTRARRLALARSGWRGIYLYSYSLLRQEPAEEELGLINPQLVIADEAHALKNTKEAAQTKRFLRLMKETKARFVGLSGTMAKRSLYDYHHLALLALRDKVPLPQENNVLSFWASALDEVGREWEKEEQEQNARGLEPLRTWALEEFRKGTFTADEVGGPLTPDPQGYRRAFRLRRNCAPGVVASAEDDLGVSLTMKNVPAPLPQPWTEERIESFETDLENRITGEEMFVPSQVFASYAPFEKMLALSWAVGGLAKKKGRATTPNGDPLQHAMQGHKWMYELSAGFYNELVWPTVPALAQERGIPETDAAALLERAKNHHNAKRKHDKELRIFLEQGDHVPGIDTPMLVHNECLRGGRSLPSKLFERWCDMENLDFAGRPERVKRAVPVCDFKIRAAIEWAKALPKNKGALVWYHNRFIGKWAAELFLAALGPERVLHCPAGPEHDEAIQHPDNADKIVIASLWGHHKGKDLQFSFSENFFLQWPRSADIAQQALGRTHRPGQKADELVFHTNNTLPFDHHNFYACLSDALWAHQAEDAQKIIVANYIETPKRYPMEFLAQRGFIEAARTGTDEALRAVLGEEKATAA